MGGRITLTFEELTSAPELLQAIRDLGWTAPTPVQARALPPVREGRDVVGIAQTGTGKTAAFLLPALERQIGREGLHTLVLCPTRELAQQVAEDARMLARYTELWIGEVFGGVPIGPQIRDLRAGFDVLVATPGRLIDHIERGTVDLSTVEVVVLDEADRMLDMGFRPQIEAVLKACPTECQTLMFSATMPNGVHALALRILSDPAWIEVTPPATAAEKVEQVVYPVRPDRKIALLLELLQRDGMDQVLVFTRTKSGADVLFSRLYAEGIDVALLHGDRDMRQRQKALAAFAEGRVRVLVATDVAQRGLDVEGISHVINFDVPWNPEDYVHRIGRTGRAGATGSAVTFLTAGELPKLHEIERALGYRLPRVVLDGYESAAASAPPARPAARLNRSGTRLGSRRTDRLTPEELQELLKVG
ncbi:MAG TPA: DEAD/DEAH box helicase [Longimicrobiales bacterium]